MFTLARVINTFLFIQSRFYPPTYPLTHQKPIFYYWIFIFGKPLKWHFALECNCSKGSCLLSQGKSVQTNPSSPTASTRPSTNTLLCPSSRLRSTFYDVNRQLKISVGKLFLVLRTRLPIASWLMITSRGRPM